MPVLKRRRERAVSPVPYDTIASRTAEADPDPVNPDHFMFVLNWQVNNSRHKLATMETYALARAVRAKARQLIDVAIMEIEAEEDAADDVLPIPAAYSAAQQLELLELLA